MNHHECSCAYHQRKITLPVMEGLLFVRINTVVRCESDNNYTHIILDTGKRITISKTLKTVESMLPESHFVRVHQSHVVNIAHVDGYYNRCGGYLQMSDSAEIPVSRRRKEALLDILRGCDLVVLQAS